MDIEDFLKTLNESTPPVKQEEPEEDANTSDNTDENPESPLSTGLEVMGAEIEAAQRKEAEDAQKLADFMQQDEPLIKRKKGKRSPEYGDDRKPDDESKGPLSTFGHSSRPRRSVNYASIEKGEEEQAKSLVTDFGTGKKRTKRTRDELDENYTEESTKRKPARNNQIRPRTQYQVATQYSARAMMDPKKEVDFKVSMPKIGDERPSPDVRLVGKTLDESVAVRRSSGGFRRFVAWLSDDHIINILTAVERYCHIDANGDDKQLLRSIRHTYNQLPENTRRDWEYAARMDVFESRIFVQGMSMPMSEILVKDHRMANQKKSRLHGVQIRSNCCRQEPILSNMIETAEHYLLHHDIVHLFGCDICHKVFPSKYELTKHGGCTGFSAYMCELTFKQETLSLQASYIYLCCCQCGLWLSLKATQGALKGWNYFATALMNHSCQPLVAVVVYFRKQLENDGKNVRLQLNVMSSIDTSFPLNCSECGTDDFKTLAEAEEHFAKNHKLIPCQKCPKSFGTEFMAKHHSQSHISQSAQFANWLLYSATFHPPPNSGRDPHIGFDSEVPAIGGCTAGEIQTLEASESKKNEFVEPLEDTYRKKVFRWRRKKREKKENRQRSGSSDDFSYESGESSGEEQFQMNLKEQENDSSSSESESDDSSDDVTSSRRKGAKNDKKPRKIKKTRGDLGYEHVDRNEMFKKSEEELEARKRLEKLINRRVFLARERLLEPEYALQELRDAQSMTLSPMSCPLADEIALATVRSIALPASNCIDPLKDLLLVNKIFSYCPKCKMVFSDDRSAHSVACDVPEEEIKEVFHAAAGPHAGVRCVFPDCKTHLCSVIGLRTHCQFVHNLTITIESPAANEPNADEFLQSRYDRSMMNLAKIFHLLLTDERTYQARLTDIDCFLPFSGVLETKVRPRTVVRRQPIPPSNFPAYPPHMNIQPTAPVQQHSQTLSQRAAYLVKAGAQRILSTCKPYKIPRTSRWFQCSWCTCEYESFEQFIEHLIQMHCHVCHTCGKAFSSSNMKRTHVCQRVFLDRQTGQSMTGLCTGCRERLQIDTLFIHILRRHFSTVEYNQATGELLPAPRDLRLEFVYHNSVERRMSPYHPEEMLPHQNRLKQIKISSGPVHGVNMNQLSTRDPPVGSFILCPPDQKHVDPRLMCYMCELTFDNVRELSAHLEDHPEKWNHCPFCSVLVANHFDLQKHLLQAHVIKMNQRSCCAFCHESHPRYMCSHMLFRCKRISRCTICGQKSSDAASNRIHMQRSHSLALRRFQCAFCTSSFVSIGEYYEHQCTGYQPRVYSCTCQPDKYFPTASVFCDHYDCVHVMRNKCTLCSFEAESPEALARHRPVHMKTQTVTSPPLKLFILVRSFFPKPDSGYMRWVDGGPAPPSYLNIDRSHQTELMGRLGGTGSSSLPRPAMTLFEALEGPSSHAPVTSATPPPRVAPCDDVIMLSDDDEEEKLDDDDCIVFEGSSAPKITNVDSQVDREVRVEKDQTGYGGSAQPGYVVEENDLEVAEGSKSPKSNEPRVKVVDDEHGDDELAVVAEVENASGTLSTNVSAGRSKQFKCPKCSLSFYTNRSLRGHMDSHRQDAGANVCTETYGLPKDASPAWLCRNCCVAFQSADKFQKHMAIHGDTVHTCTQCSGIAFNHATIQNHMNAHYQKQVSYACGTCLFKFHSDLALMDHLHCIHGIQLFYFCKVCGFGSTNADKVTQHMLQHTAHRYTMVQRFGACPVALINYDPTDEEEFRAKLLQKKIALYSPSDCSHRSLLLQNETVVACKTCFCTQGWFNYMAFNHHSEETGFPTFQMMAIPTDSRREFPLVRHVSQQNGLIIVKNLQRGGAGTGGAGTTRMSSPSTRNGRFPAEPVRRDFPPPPSRFNGTSPVVSVSANGARIIRPVIQPAASQQQTLAQRRIIVARPGGAGTVGGALRGHVPVSTKCQTCSQTLASEFDRQLHTMHESENSWFCRQCGVSHSSEIDLFLHYVKSHLTPAHQKHQGVGFKSNIFSLRCPVEKCQSGVFQSPKAFEKHMRNEHSDALPFESPCCDARFASRELCEMHEQKHNEFLETNGTDAPCCTICGALNAWSLPKDPVTDCLQSHIIRHGLDYRSSCRSCLKQFPADIDQTRVTSHIRQCHATCAVQGPAKCNLCNELPMNEMDFLEHCRQKHVFHILAKSALSMRGELVVSTGSEYENYVGLIPKPPKLVANRPILRAPTVTVTATPISEKSLDISTITASDGGNAALLSIAAAIDEAGNDDVMMIE